MARPGSGQRQDSAQSWVGFKARLSGSLQGHSMLEVLGAIRGAELTGVLFLAEGRREASGSRESLGVNDQGTQWA